MIMHSVSFSCVEGTEEAILATMVVSLRRILLCTGCVWSLLLLHRRVRRYFRTKEICRMDGLVRYFIPRVCFLHTAPQGEYKGVFLTQFVIIRLLRVLVYQSSRLHRLPVHR